ncbi:uncharacterized protein LOC142582853 [Dermacentor variabilis]|uniref:uncharacterized protein LOC142582853 n=1 Tax=Dermacentor variabilis TaxID=34621 RepID=UPI003F5BCDB2
MSSVGCHLIWIIRTNGVAQSALGIRERQPADRMDVTWPRAALPSFYGGTFQVLDRSKVVL